MPNKIIIWGRDDYNTLGLLRQLSGEERNVFFLMWDKPIGCASASKYFQEHTNVFSIEEGYQYLLHHSSDAFPKPVIFTDSDEIIEFIDKHRVSLEKYYIIPGTQESGLLSKINNKNNMSKLAKKLGFLVPESRICKWNSDISGIQYPCILKPAHITAGHRNEFKYLICKDERILRKALNHVRPESEFILQQYIPKESDALVYGCRLLNGNTLIAGTIVRDRFCRTGETSHGLVCRNLPNGISRDQIVSFLSEIDYCGLFSIEYGLYKGDAYFFEINLRNDGTSHFFYQVGANIPLALYKNMIKEDYSSINTEVKTDAWYIDEIYDIANILNGTISYKTWKKEKDEATIFKYYDVNDLQPWKKMRRHRVINIIKDAIIKKYRIYIVWIADKLNIKL